MVCHHPQRGGLVAELVMRVVEEVLLVGMRLGALSQVAVGVADSDLNRLEIGHKFDVAVCRQ